MSERSAQLIQPSLLQIAQLVGESTPAVVRVTDDRLPQPLIYVVHDYWPSKDDRALALGQAATAEMTIGGDAASKGARYGILWAHVVVPRASIDFGDETGLSWRRLEDDLGLDYRETEALLGFEFDIDAGFEINVVPLTRTDGVIRLGDGRAYSAAAVHEPLPGLILMRTVAENAPVKEYQ